jgi:hypothetical protein
MPTLVTAQELVDKGGHVLDGDVTVTVHVTVGGNLLTPEQLVNQVGHIVDSDVAFIS